MIGYISSKKDRVSAIDRRLIIGMFDSRYDIDVIKDVCKSHIQQEELVALNN